MRCHMALAGDPRMGAMAGLEWPATIDGVDEPRAVGAGEVVRSMRARRRSRSAANLSDCSRSCCDDVSACTAEGRTDLSDRLGFARRKLEPAGRAGEVGDRGAALLERDVGRGELGREAGALLGLGLELVEQLGAGGVVALAAAEKVAQPPALAGQLVLELEHAGVGRALRRRRHGRSRLVVCPDELQSRDLSSAPMRRS